MSEDESSSSNRWAPPPPPPTKKSYTFDKPESKPKIVRVLTVVAYVLSVSLAAILLSVYYIFLWKEEGPKTASLRAAECGATRVVTEMVPVKEVTTKVAEFESEVQELWRNSTTEAEGVTNEFKESAPIAAFQEETTVPPPLPLLNSSENVTDIYDDIGVETVYINREDSVLLKKLIKHKPYIN